jgi:amino acid transporter
MQPVRPTEEEPSRPVGRILQARRRGLEAEIIDEGFWGSPRRRLPLTGSGLVDALVLAVVILAIATVIGLALLWPHGKVDRSGQLGPIRTVGAVAEKVRSVRLGRCVMPYLGASQSRLSLQGLLVAGMVIGALGVLVDLTVSQASTVIALRRVSPSLGFGGLFRRALEVGHDHIAATVATLVFAYAGAALPVLLILSVGGTSFADAVNGEAVADEAIAALVGSIGLIASMPITTALAALLAPRMSDKQLAAAEHAHAH